MTVRELIEELQKCDGDMVVLGACYRGPYEVDDVWKGSIEKSVAYQAQSGEDILEWDEFFFRKDDYSGTHKVVYLR